MSDRPPCKGLLGLILGHKFSFYEVTSGKKVTSHCLRCGLRAGGDHTDGN